MPNRIHFSQFFLTSHPAPVREAIARHRRGLDESPLEYVRENWVPAENRVEEAAAKYLEVNKNEIVLTDSTTMGLSLLYNGFKLMPGDDVMTTTHAHFSLHKSLDYAVAKKGATLRKIALYEDPASVSTDALVDSVMTAIQPNTRIIALTWVDSCTGVKTPVRAISDAVQDVNMKRDADDRIYVCVDGVHGFGIDAVTMEDLGCDFFAAGAHKWLFGPRGTGILWGKKDAWDMISPTIPSFRDKTYMMWEGAIPEGPIEFNDWITPGGFHAFEHCWALKEAFDFHLDIGKQRIQDRTWELSSLLKEALNDIKGVRLHTPLAPELSAGINCFEIEGLHPKEAAKRLFEKGIIATASPYRQSFVRLAPSIVNTEEEVEFVVEAVKEISV